MPFSLDSIKNDAFRPIWIGCEDLTAAQNQYTSPILNEQNNTFSLNVEGSINRPPGTVYAIVKILATIIRNHHLDDGKHDIFDDDVNDNAGIKEHKLDLLFRYIENHHTHQNFQDSEELANLLNLVYDWVVLALKLHRFWYAQLDVINNKLKNLFPIGFTEKSEIVYSYDERKLYVSNQDKLFFDSLEIFLKDTTNNQISIPFSLQENKISFIGLKLSKQLVNDKLYYYGNKNGQFLQIDNNTPITDIFDFIVNKHNLVFYDTQFNMYQMLWEFVEYNVPTNITNFEDGLTYIPNLSKINGLIIDTDDNSIVIPIGLIHCYNKGVYHPQLNAFGTSKLRNGKTITYQTDCFQQENIAYLDDDGNECPDYDNATYNQQNDFYELNGIIYQNSCFSMYSRPDNLTFDNPKILTFKPKLIINMSERESTIVKMFLNNDLITKANTLYVNNLSNRQGFLSSIKPTQVLSFALSLQDGVGTFETNQSVIYVDKTNNNLPAKIDGIRRCYSDKTRVVNVSVLISNNNGNILISRPEICFYNNGRLTISTQNLTGNPKILKIEYLSSKKTKKEFFPDNNTYIFDCENLFINDKVYLNVTLEYPKGNGNLFLLDKVFKITDLQHNNKNFLYYHEIYKALDYNINQIEDVLSSVMIRLNCEISKDYIGSYICFLNRNNPTYTKIVYIDDDLKTVTLEDDLSPVQGENVSIQVLEPNKEFVVIDAFGRGIYDCFKRELIRKDDLPFYIENPFKNSHGFVFGSVLDKVLDSISYVDIVRSPNILENGLLIFFENHYQGEFFVQNQKDLYKPLYTLKTKLGSSCNTFEDVYRFPFIPTFSVKDFLDYGYFGDDCGGYKLVNYVELVNLKGYPCNSIYQDVYAENVDLRKNTNFVISLGYKDNFACLIVDEVNVDGYSCYLDISNFFVIPFYG